MESFLPQIALVNSYLEAHPALTIFLVVWSLFWKAQALWRSAQLSHRWWFVIILVLNTLGLLEIYYLYFVSRKYSVQVEEV
ncbi:hypothetical protein EPN83_03270 [Patescibacteria group bacterium]|nr:MAG: hypothetical protein EPN83_03270 [Patescibacteria group bacterium]